MISPRHKKKRCRHILAKPFVYCCLLFVYPCVLLTVVSSLYLALAPVGGLSVNNSDAVK